MVSETHGREGLSEPRAHVPAIDDVARQGRRLVAPAGWIIDAVRRMGLSSLTRRIVLLNMAALVALLGGILYLNQFRAGLIDARVDSLLTQGQIIAAAIAAQATVETDAITIDPDKLLELEAGESISPFAVGEGAADFPINPERVAPLLKRLVSPTGTQARIYDQDGTMLLDSRGLYSRGQILRFDLPAPDETRSWSDVWGSKVRTWLRRNDLPTYRDIGAENGREYPEVATALDGASASIVRVGEDGGLVVSVAVPIQRFRAVLGTLLLSTKSGDIDAIVRAEREAIIRVFIVAGSITILLAVLLASTIAGPVRRLSSAAERVRKGVKHREEIPDFGDRKDEIGDLARSLRDMTDALYDRMDAIERFAADVAHELKNPLTSLRSAVETLPIAPSLDDRRRLLGVIQHDVQRLDRLISDISKASRLDTELAREVAAPYDLATLLETVCEIARENQPEDEVRVTCSIRRGRYGRDGFVIPGTDSRIGQVFTNLLDNAVSFSPRGSTVRVLAVRNATKVAVVVDDDGRGIQAEDHERIFERFYTDRPEAEAFGQNSGLGLAISRQIVKAHNGTISGENRYNPDGTVAGARFTVVLPAAP